MKFLMFLVAVASLSLPSFVLAALNQAPPSFAYLDGKAVYVDFITANYQLTYDSINKKVDVDTVIRFSSLEHGYPIFDLVAEPSAVTLNGKQIPTTGVMDPDLESIVRVLQEKVTPGIHELRIKHTLTTNVIFDTGVYSGFWMSDLNDRRYLEQYLPTNLEFDQYRMHFLVRIPGHSLGHVIKANGKVRKIAENNFEIQFPDFYTASSVYFHLFPAENSATNVQFYFPSMDGRLIPVDIYTTYNIQEFVDATKTILQELEDDYGPFPHNQLVIYGNAPSGGMEHSGATATSLKALGHELFHSYHARALMPANGNAGWMDEAIARWRDDKYPLIEKLDFSSTQLGGHSLWSRKTDRMAYTEGSAFLSWIAFRMDEKGLSFKGFLKDYFQKYKYTSVTTQLFQKELILASGLELDADFDRYIYGKNSNKSVPRSSLVENPYHPELTKEQLLQMTKL
ncbi:MAG TPA: hypothetical protein VNJ08_10255 [Bacteriovoracaceae bacterium]|nr:hypothetical protein [Bacteriovoracaceae bacterium]